MVSGTTEEEEDERARLARVRRYLRVRDLGGFLGQAAALCRDQVVVLGADVLV